ncbi:NT-type C2 domain [Dillenia turbinata]|uniref:NT-type C2 domain n=1 Tax=Dillenia turbinata TaxID=194707 RepID=A0AAN8WA19_9MAGN
MFRLQRQKPIKSGERIDFKLSNFQALQVPKGWDKLLLSVINVETGKTIAKSNKAAVRNGSCHWAEAFSESIWVSHNETSKELEECLFKIIIAMGSAKSGILGEVMINMTNYIGSTTSVPVSLPLKKCNYGTTLQVKIRCLTPRTKNRDENSKDIISAVEGKEDFPDLDTNSDNSGSYHSRSVGSSSREDLALSSHGGELGNRETGFSASSSQCSYDSARGSIRMDHSSPVNDQGGNGDIQMEKQGLRSSSNSPAYGNNPDEESLHSSHSSFDSRVMGSVVLMHNPKKEFGQQHIVATSLRTTNSSDSLLEAAENTIEELRTETKMWEREAKKTMFDLEILRKEFSNQSKILTNLEMELSAANMERDSLREEVAQLKLMLEASAERKTANGSTTFQDNSSNQFHKELQDELKFQQEYNANLSLQLQRSQESNIELVAVLQELEETIERQRIEIEKLSVPESKPGDLENSITRTMEDNRTSTLHLQQLQHSEKALHVNVQCLEQAPVVKDQEIEKERCLNNQNLMNMERSYKSELTAKEEKILSLEAKLCESVKSSQSEESGLAKGGGANLMKEIKVLEEKIVELERDCAELTEENLELLLKLKDSKCNFTGTLDVISSSEPPPKESASSEPEVSELKSKIHFLEEELVKMEREAVAIKASQSFVTVLENKCNDLELQLQTSKNKVCNLEKKLLDSQAKEQQRSLEITALQEQLKCCQENETDKEDQLAASEMRQMFSEGLRQVQMAFANVTKPWSSGISHVDCDIAVDLDSLVISSGITLKEQSQSLLKYLIALNKVLEAKISECSKVLDHSEAEIIEKDKKVAATQKMLEDYISQEMISDLKLRQFENLKLELDLKVRKLSDELIFKISETQRLEVHLLSKEEEIGVLKQSVIELEAQVSDLHREKLQLEENMEIVTRESHITSKRINELRNDLAVLSSSAEIHESNKMILENKVLELENAKHCLELQLSELEDEKMQLSDHIFGLEAQLKHPTDGKESSQLELQDSRSHIASLEDQISRLKIQMETREADLKEKLQEMQSRWSEAQDECQCLRRSNSDLQDAAKTLIGQLNSLQRENEEWRKDNQELVEQCKCLEVALRDSQSSLSECSRKAEDRFSSMLEEFAAKERSLTSELDALCDENERQKENLVLGESLLNQMHKDKAVEIEGLQREVKRLKEQVSAAQNEKEGAVLKISSLLADKAQVESTLHEVQTKVKAAENQLRSTQMESETKVQSLTGEVASFREKQEMLTTKHDKMLKLVEKLRVSEENLRTLVNGLELQLAVSDYEKQQLKEETSSLKGQLMKFSPLEGEILALKTELDSTKFAKEKLEASMEMISSEYEKLKAEKLSLIGTLQNSLAENEESKYNRFALEEKILQMESDLTARKALCAQDAELKNEISQFKSTNRQLLWKIEQLEVEKSESIEKAQALEEELRLMKKEKQAYTENVAKKSVRENARDATNDTSSKLQLLENELAQALEANKKYKHQLNRLLSEGRNGHTDASCRSIAESDKSVLERYQRTKSSLELELRDIRERYFNMSLKYAEVEAQREELVMKLKAEKSGKRWFS